MRKRQVALDELSATGDHVRPRSGGRWARQVRTFVCESLVMHIDPRAWVY